MTPGGVAGALDERRRLGLDGLDEMWEGELHMVPAPTNEHGRIEVDLLMALMRQVRRAGLHARIAETAVFDPGVPGATSYRIPDISTFDPSAGSERGIEGRATLVVEIRSPDDESLAKIPFYSRVGVAEMLVVDRDTKEVRRWLAAGRAGLVEVAAERDGWHHLDGLAIRLRSEDATLVVVDGASTHRI